MKGTGEGDDDEPVLLPVEFTGIVCIPPTGAQSSYAKVMMRCISSVLQVAVSQGPTYLLKSGPWQTHVRLESAPQP